MDIKAGQIWRNKKTGTQVKVEKIEAGQIIFSFSSGYFATLPECIFRELHELLRSNKGDVSRMFEINEPKEIIVKADKFTVNDVEVDEAWIKSRIKERVGVVHPKENVLKPDMVNKPPHYKDASGIECKEITCHREMPFSLGNAIKYLYRAGSKGDLLEDLKKAHWYIKGAYFNNEVIPKDVVRKLEEVAAHRTVDIKLLMLLISRNDLIRASTKLKQMIDELEGGNE